MKANFNANSMKQFCIDHVEKFVLGGVVLLLLLFAARAVQIVSRDRVPFTPTEMSTAAKDAIVYVNSTKLGDYALPTVVLYHEIQKRASENILEKHYEPKVPFNRPDFEQRSKRGVPELLAVEDLRASAGNGALQMGARGAGAAGGPGVAEAVRGSQGVRGQRWVALTGLIPIKEQMDAFEATFADALFRRQQDVPMYLGYQIERADVTSGPEPDQVKWESIDLRRAFGILSRFGSGMSQGTQEVVHQKYLPQQPREAVFPLVFRLPPVMNKVWGSEVAHPPEIPLLIDMSPEERGFASALPGAKGAEGAEASPDGPKTPEGAKGPEDADMPEGFGPFEGAAGLFGQGGMEGGMPGMMPGDVGGMPGMMPGGRGGMPGIMPGGGEMGMGYGMPGAGRMGMRVEKPVEHQLLRFFDFNVEPGRRYQYRVRLVLANPNYLVEARYLEQEELGKKFWIARDDWSGPSEAVLVPRDSRLLAGPVKAPPSLAYEPSAQVIAVTIRMDDGLEAAQDYTVFRGHLANFEGKVDQGPARGAYGMSGMGGMMPGAPDEMPGMKGAMGPGPPEGPRRPQRRDEDEEEEEKINHATEMLVLDIAGGDRLHRSDRTLTVPGSLLLLDLDGNLLIQKELEDLEEYLVYHEAEEEARPRRSKTTPEDDMMMPGMMPGMEAGGGYGAYGMGDADSENDRRRSKKKPRGSRRPGGAYE
ncbi:MAG: hypothetical protein ABIK89_19300 [Planctomycetota bacterium]